MSTRSRDYGPELIAVVVLGVLSALSQFWFMLIALGLVLALYEGSFLVCRLFRAHSSTQTSGAARATVAEPNVALLAKITPQGGSTLPVA